MSMRRKNKSRNQLRGSYSAKWFLNNVNRQRCRREIALKSRRRNRS